MIRRNDSQYSRFWMGGEGEFKFDPTYEVDGWDTDTLLRLASFKRAIANFVRIVTGKPIPVVYNTGTQSYTQGSVVVLSAKLEHNQFDTAVGVALHEATHCALTDFQLHSYMQFYQHTVVEMFENLHPKSVFERLFRGKITNPKYIEMLLSEVDYDLVFSIFERVHKLYGGSISSTSYTSSKLWSMSKMLENWVEDRRIDYYQFTTSPGYKGYYNAMYSSYFWSKLIGKAVRAKNYARTETWESYQFRIINLLHPNTDLDALKGLRDIWNLLDIRNIDRLKSTCDSWNLGYRILDIVLRSIEREIEEKMQSPTPTPEQCDNGDELGEKVDGGENEEGDNEATQGKPTSKKREEYDDEVDDSDDSFNEPSDTDPLASDEKDNETGDANLDLNDGEGTPFRNPDIESPEDDEEEASKEEEGEPTESSNDVDGKSDKDEETLSPNEKKKMEKEEEKQNKFLEDETPKKKMKNKTADAIKSLEESDVTLTSVGQGIKGYNGKQYQVQCVVIRKITKELFEGSVFDNMFWDPRYANKTDVQKNQDAIEEGMRLGTMLGKKLQVRNEARITRYNRLETGRIDKKLLASLGYDNANVFYRTMVDKYNPMMMHISVDASTSMKGQKWYDTMTLLVSIIKASTMTSNLDVVVTMRGTTSGMNVVHGRRSRWGYKPKSRTRMRDGYSITNRPLVAIVYDSRVDKLSKVMSLFKYIHPGGTTPEGLAFEPLIDEMVAGKKGEIDSLFVNISDGQPCFHAEIVRSDGYSEELSYVREIGAKHTASMVQKMRSLNINILSYLIQSNEVYAVRTNEEAKEIFHKCYGKDARYIDVKSIMQIAKTLNEKFLEKHN